MTRIEDYKESVQKAQDKVEKCKGTIKKHEAAAAKKLEALVKKGITLVSWKDDGFYDLSWEDKTLVQDYEGKLNDAKGATSKLKEAEGILAGWQARLDKEVEKERFINNQAPQVIRDFLEAWKVKATEWQLRKYKGFPAFKEKLKQDELVACLTFLETTPGYEKYLDAKGKLPKDNRTWDFYHNRVHPRKPMDAYLKEQQLDNGSIKAREMGYAGFLVLRMIDFRDEAQALVYLERELEREKQNKMIDLINRVNEVVGTITDAAGLRIDPMGNLNGIVVGKKAKAKVETIGAGGWNIQCFHFRVLVHEQK